MHSPLVGPTPADTTDTRAEVLEAAIELVRRRAVHEVTYADIARAAGVDESWLHDHFESWEFFLADVLERWSDHRRAGLASTAEQSGAIAYLRDLTVANLADPGLMRVLLSLVSTAAAPDHPVSALLRHRWIGFHATVQRALVEDVRVGREPPTMNPARGAEQLIALYEGLYIQSVLRPHMDLVEAYDRAVTRLRAGWSHPYSPADAHG